MEQSNVQKMWITLVCLWSDESVITDTNLVSSAFSLICLTLGVSRAFSTIARTWVCAHVKLGSNNFRIIVEIKSTDWKLWSWATVRKAMFLFFSSLLQGPILYCNWVFPNKNNFLRDTLPASEWCFMLVCTNVFLCTVPTSHEKTFLHNLTLFTSVSSLIRNGYSRLRTSENIQLLLGRGHQFKIWTIVNTIEHANMPILYCLFCVKLNMSPYRTRLTSTSHITTRHRFQFETNIAIKTDSNKLYTGSEIKLLRMRTHFLYSISKWVREANSWIR